MSHRSVKRRKKKALDLPPFNSLAEGERWCKLSHSLLTELLTLDTTELDCKSKNPCKWQNRKGVSLEAALSFIASLYNYTLPFKATCESCLCSLLLFPRPWGKCIVAIPCQIQTPSDQAFLNMALQWSCWGKEKKGETFFHSCLTWKAFKVQNSTSEWGAESLYSKWYPDSPIFFLPFWDHQSKQTVFACIS